MGTAATEILERRVLALRPEPAERLDSPYRISKDLYLALRHVLHDVGGQPDRPVPYLDQEEMDWELRTYVTCEVLAWRGAWNAEERRRRENDLGATQYFGLPYYARWVTVATKMLIDKGLVTPDELSAKVDEVRSRRKSHEQVQGR